MNGAPADACFTVITSTTPAYAGKVYSLDAKRKLKKGRAKVAIAAGKAVTVKATPENLLAMLELATESENQVIGLDSFIGAAPGAPAEIGVVIENELERLIGGAIPSAPETGFYLVNGKPVAARLKRLMQSSGWILIDADTPEGMPARWAGLSLIERLKLLEAILPGISTCLRVEYRGSSSRVVNGSGDENPGPTHALIQISDPGMLDLLSLYVKVQSVLHDLSFESPRYSKLKPGKISSYNHLTLIDLAVWVLGRLIINARPDVAKALGYHVLKANPRIVNPNGGVLDIGWITPPNADQVSAYRLKTGRALSFYTEGKGGFAVREDGQLRLDTEIESRGAAQPLYEWLVEMLDGDIVKLRCEAPFRASESEAALIRITERGEVFVYDSGTSISSYLAPLPQTAEDARATAATLDECEMIEAVIGALERRTQRQVAAAFSDPPYDPPEDPPNSSPDKVVIEPYDFWSHGDPPDMPLGLLPERIESYARSASIVVGADAGGFAVSALAIAAAAIDDAIKLQVMPFSKWMERARLWVALVGPPGVKKTPIINTTCEALENEDTKLWRAYKAAKAFYDMSPKAEKARTPPPVRERYIVGDATVEALQEAFKSTMRGLLGLHDELGGWLGALDRYGTSGQTYADRAFMLRAYNGGRCPVSRIGRGDYVLENVSLSILGGIQPDVIRKFANGVDDDGLIQRIIPVMLRPGWPPMADQKASEAVQAFSELTPLLLNLSPPAAGSLQFDEGAQRIRDELAQDHAKMSAVAEGFNKKLSTAIDKQDGVFARLCVVFHCVEHAGNPLGPPEIVTEDIARRVEGFMIEYTRKHLFHFYGAAVLGVPEEQERLASIAGFILTRKLNTFANWEMQAAVRSLRKLTSKDVTPVMETLEALGWVRRTEAVRTGAPPRWAVNPAVHDGRFEKQSKEEAKRREEARELIAKAAVAKRKWRAVKNEV